MAHDKEKQLRLYRETRERTKEKQRLMPFDEQPHYLRRELVLEEQNHCCAKCGLDKWLGNLIPLELEHKDGDNTNNSRANLEFLCPNCHAMTDTWRGRNKKKGARNITDEEMLKALSSTPNIRQALIALGLSPKGNNYARAKRLMFIAG